MAGLSISDQSNRTAPARELPSPRLLRIHHWFVNSYLVGEPGRGEWALVDAGFAPSCAKTIARAAARRVGREARPAAIILTHGHFDHVGGVKKLLQRWDVPVYAHELELPYLTGRSAYPPPDPTVGGGLMARTAGLLPRKPLDLGNRIQVLPPDGVVPGMPGWRWVSTPGHSPGHISLFRFTDRTLIAGDAFVTVQQESLLAVLLQRPRVSRPPAYFTADWQAARQSVEALLALDPEVAATGHGLPMGGEVLRQQLRTLVREFDRRARPVHGRYVNQPALTDRRGVVSLPPPVPDPMPKLLLGTAVALGALLWFSRSRRGESGKAAPAS
jgi:glyoxylase-like metal-dependent hydrolase (beta-lactamase superfamily II)